MMQEQKKQRPFSDLNDPMFNKFFNCLATIMEVQLQNLCLKSMTDYVDYLYGGKTVSCNKSHLIQLKRGNIIIQHTQTIYISISLEQTLQKYRCMFTMNITMINKAITFDPMFNVYSGILLSILNSLSEGVSIYPRLEYVIYPGKLTGEAKLLMVISSLNQ